MKKVLFVYIAVLLLSAPVLGSAQTDESKKSSKELLFRQMIEAREFVFVANMAVPMRGMIIQQLNYPYDLRIAGDSVIADLPYFGRAFVAPMDPTAGGIRFVSTKSEYEVQQRKKGGWDISIRPSHSDRTDARQLNLTVFANGQATLRVTNTNRDPISFHGYIIGIP